MTGLDEVDKRSLTQEQHGSRPEMCKTKDEQHAARYKISKCSMIYMKSYQ